MKIFNLKSVLILAGFIWVCLSFLGFADLAANRSAQKIADTSLTFAQSEFEQKSKDLRFKLAQWFYNYHLVKTKGVDFDQEGFQASEFNDIYFFKLDGSNIKTQWIKSKDMQTAAVPTQLTSRLKQWSKEQLEDKDFIYFSDKAAGQNAKVFFGFPISDEVMGDGLVLSSLDLDLVQLLSTSLNTYALDSRGRYIFHPKKEYIAQNANQLMALAADGGNEAFLVKSISTANSGIEFVYRAPKAAVLINALWPMIIMSLGLLLAFGVLIFEIYMQAPLNFKSSYDISSAHLKASEMSKDEYGSILKLNEVRDSLNQMSLMSSVLKGRLDLAANGEMSSQLLETIKNDFATLDRSIESTYRSSQNLETESKLDLSNIENVTVSENPEIGDFSEENPALAELQASPEKKEKAPNSIAEAALAFRDQGFDLEDDATFDGLEFSDLDLDNDLSEEFSVQLDELDSEARISLDDEESEDSSEEGVVFQEYLGADSEVNDWAKIINELTEEINTAELKPSRVNAKDDGLHG